MINVSQTIKNSCKADANTHTEYIKINNQIIYIKGKLNATAYKDTTFIGTFNMKVLEFETENTTQFRNRQFEYYKVIDGNSFKIGTFITTQVVDNDSSESVKVTANDYGLKFAVPYTSILNYESGQITLFQVLQECCTNAGVTLENQSITNGDFIVDSNQFVNGELIGDVICAIAGISGNFATITNQDKLKLLFYEETDEVLEDYTDLDDKRDTQPFTSVLIGTSVVEGQEAILKDNALIEQYGEHWVKIIDNPFAYTLAKRQQLVTALFNKLKGFGYSAFKSEYTYRPYLTLGDKIQFKNKAGQLVDSIILRYEMNFDNCTFEAPSITSASIEYDLAPNEQEIARRAEIIANQAEATIISVTSEVNQQNSKIATIRQDVDIIMAEISDIADITISGESTEATFNLDNINESEPIVIRVYPTTTNISYLYPTSSLFPSSSTYLKNRKVRFHNNTTNENFDYILPTDLLIYDTETYDEFYLDYDSQTCQVTKKCGYNADGSVYALATEQILTYTYPEINLTEGDYTISLLGYTNGYIFARLMSKNIYTSQFYTKVETNSKIEQKANEITSTVSSTYATKNDLDYAKSQIKQTTDNITLEVATKVGEDEVISSINQSAENVTINANRVNIDGVVTAINNDSSTTIDGNKITTGSINASQINVGAITEEKIASNSIGSGKIKSSAIDSSKIADNGITTTKIADGAITTDKLSANSVTANKVSSDIITTNNFSAQSINANNITTGTLNGNNVNITNLSASNITGGTLSADKIDGGTISGSAINLGSGKLKVTTGGSLQYYNNPGFLYCGGNTSNHPYVSALNVARGSGGISFRDGTGRTDAGSQKAQIYESSSNLYLASNGAMYLEPSGTININSSGHGKISTASNKYLKIQAGNSYSPGSNNGSMYLYAQESVSINSKNGHVYVGAGSTTNSRVATDDSGPSSKCLKENIKEFTQNNYDDALDLLRDIKIYSYNYKYNLSDFKNQYGFIIDDLLDNENAKKFLYFKDEKAVVKDKDLDYQLAEEEPNNKNILNFKRYDEEILVRYLLTANKALLNKIENLEQKIEKLERESDK